MQMRKNLIDVFTVLRSDETLLRLLYYTNEDSDALDDPLDPAKPNILDMPDNPRTNIINDRIKTTPKVNDLDGKKKCRICVFPWNRNGTNNYLIADQQFAFDTWVNLDVDEVDQRLSKICDRISEIIFNERITGIGKVMFDGGKYIGGIKDYVGYRLIYEFCTFQK